MEISQFELVYKPQSPAGTADTVLQGYFLEITNLEDRDLSFALRLTTSSVSDPDRSLFGNAAVFVDTPGVNNNIGLFTLTGALTDVSFGLNRRIFVPAKGTALVAVLPSDPFAMMPVPPSGADFECRGYVSLTLPPILQRVQLPNGRFVFTFVSQGGEPQKVLLTAQSRALYQDPATGAAKGQTQSSLPISTGKGLNEIDPQPPFVFPGNLNLGAVAQLAATETGFVDMLAGMLSTAAESQMDLKSFNAALKKAGVGMAVEKR